MVGKTAPINQQDRGYLDIVSSVPCVCCMIDGWIGVPAQAHHVTEGMKRLDDEHQQVVPICPWHHQGIPTNGLPEKQMRRIYGPSLELHKRAFNRRYGSDRELIQITQALVRILRRELDAMRWLPHGELMSITKDLHKEIVRGMSVV